MLSRTSKLALAKIVFILGWLCFPPVSFASQQPTLKVGLPYFDVPPYIYIDKQVSPHKVTAAGYPLANSAYSGLMVDVLRKVANQTGFEYQL
ncbi:hypothetical protein, partial [Photobacterium sanctipauli]